MHLRYDDMGDACNGETLTDANTTRSVYDLTCPNRLEVLEVLDAGDFMGARLSRLRSKGLLGTSRRDGEEHLRALSHARRARPLRPSAGVAQAERDLVRAVEALGLALRAAQQAEAVASTCSTQRT